MNITLSLTLIDLFINTYLIKHLTFNPFRKIHEPKKIIKNQPAIWSL